MSAKEVRGAPIRNVALNSLQQDSLPVLGERKAGYADGYDVNVVCQVGKHKMRVSLPVSSGVELGIPNWLRLSLRMLAQEQGLPPDTEIAFYLSTRPLWLVPGAQDEAARLIAERQRDQPIAAQLTEAERDAIGVQWLADRLRKAGVKPELDVVQDEEE